MQPLGKMQPIKEYSAKEELHLLTKSFAKNLLNRGFSQEDLVLAATAMLDQAIQSKNIDQTIQSKDTSEIRKRDHLKVIS